MSTLNQASDRQPADPQRGPLHLGGRVAAVLTPRRVIYGSVIAVVLLVSAVLATTFFPKHEAAGDVSLASALSGEPPLLLIRFSAQATEPQIHSFLGTYHAEVVSGPRRGNFYDVRITGEPSPADVNAIVRKMQDETEIVDLVAEKE
jgi:hypothetical protein